VLGKQEVIRFIRHAAHWRRFFPCSLATAGPSLFHFLVQHPDAVYFIVSPLNGDSQAAPPSPPVIVNLQPKYGGYYTLYFSCTFDRARQKTSRGSLLSQFEVDENCPLS
jgi:hypothetical protein